MRDFAHCQIMGLFVCQQTALNFDQRCDAMVSWTFKTCNKNLRYLISLIDNRCAGIVI